MSKSSKIYLNSSPWFGAITIHCVVDITEAKTGREWGGYVGLAFINTIYSPVKQ
jgi:hypothetical protein